MAEVANIVNEELLFDATKRALLVKVLIVAITEVAEVVFAALTVADGEL